MGSLRMWSRALLAAGAAAVMVVTSVSAPSARADNLEDAKAKVERLQTEASAVAEDLEDAEIQLKAGQKKLALLRDDIAAQQERVDQLSGQARQVALQKFQDRGVDTTVALFVDADPDSFLDRLVTTSSVDENITATLTEYASAQADLASMQRSAEADVAALSAEQERLDTLKKDLDSKVSEAETVVNTLTEQARRELTARSGARVSFDTSELDDEEVSAQIKKVISYATSKVSGSQYVWGASGPNSFDCSGLMLAAYSQIGVSLPHSSRGQYSVGKAVSRSELKPGDLIFWYQPIHHVGMYIGNGKIVHARNVRDDLVIQTLNSYPAPFTGARRVLG